MTKTAKTKSRPADTFELAQIASAKSFAASLFLGKGKWAKAEELATLEAARAAGAALVAEHKSKKLPLVYARAASGADGSRAGRRGPAPRFR